MLISVIIITLNEEASIARTIDSIKNGAKLKNGRSIPIEIIVSDGGSKDNTLPIANRLANKIIVSKNPSRCSQLNQGARISEGDVLLFLHADTILPDGAIIRIVKKMQNPRYSGGGFEKDWSWNSNIQVSSFIKFSTWFWQSMGNWLVRVFYTFPGDNAIFIRNSIFKQLNGYRTLWICEDFDLMLRLKKYSKKNSYKLACIGFSVLTSTRRMEKYGFFKTVFLWFMIYFLWRFGMNPERIKVVFQNYSTIPETGSRKYLRF